MRILTVAPRGDLGNRKGSIRMEAMVNSMSPGLRAVLDYWEAHIHDVAIVRHPVGSEGFFRDLERYRFEKLDYLKAFVGFDSHPGKLVLEVGCGGGIDLACFARGGAIVTGIDLSPRAIGLARENFCQQRLRGELLVMNGEALQFQDASFDVVYAHGVLQYTPDAARMVREIHRVLKPGGLAILQVYNRISWLYFLSRAARVSLEHEDAPAFRVHTEREFRELLRPFARVQLVHERFPVRTHLHRGLKAVLYNGVFVGACTLLPRRLLRRLGWHLIARAWK